MANESPRVSMRHTWAVGLTLTAAMVVLALAGVTGPAERAWYDARAAWFQFLPPQAEQAGRVAVVHIDDAAIEQRRWPWPRSRVARIVDELDRAGAAVIAPDLLFREPEAPSFDVTAEGEPGDLIDHDHLLAESLASSARALLPVMFPRRDALTAADRAAEAALLPQLRHAPGRSLADARERAEGDVPAGVEPTDVQWQAAFVRARDRAVQQHLHEAIDAGAATWQDALSQMLPAEQAGDDDTILRRVARRQWQRVEAERAVQPLGRVLRPDDPLATGLPRVERIRAPIKPLAAAAQGVGFVDWHGQGTLRSVPMWIKHEGRAYPQLGLAVAARMLDVDLDDIDASPTGLRLSSPRHGQIHIPTHAELIDGQRTRHHFAVPFRGPRQWELMFDVPDHREPVGHIDLLSVWEVSELQRRLRDNNRQADRALAWVLSVMDPTALETWQDNPPADDDWPARRDAITDLLADDGLADMIAFTRDLHEEGEELDDASLGLLEGYDDLERVIKINDDLAALHRERSAALRERIEGRAVFIGWSATGAVADFVATPLHSACPGVVVHAAVTQAILNGDFWRQAPAWAGYVAIIVVGLLVVAGVSWLSPTMATLAAGVVLGAWVVVDGLLLFDRNGVLVAGAAPMLTVALTWGGCVGWRYFTERRERTRITRRFSSYVDPALVDYVIAHPQQQQLQGEVREMTVVFTDLAGFTTLSEKLGSQSVELLNDYMGVMVPLIREQGGFVNKFLGDGIMFFYGAPQPREDHAAAAVRTVLAMQDAMTRFSGDLTARGLPPVAMRAGVATGRMIVGDAGPPDASDYTVLGDTVNLAARLESANKATGTATLITQRTVDLMHGQIGVRPVGALQVVGKDEPVHVYEPLGPADALEAATRRVIDLSREMVDAYVAARFADCLTAADALAAEHPASRKLADLYRDAARTHIDAGPAADFTGQIVLAEK